jgi:hypothetical protein
MNPLWAILAVNLLALFVVPFLTYHFAHKNNLKILKEKWISELRNAATELIEACEKLYSANDSLCSSTSGGNILPDNLRKDLDKRIAEAQAHVTSAKAKIKLLFKDGDDAYQELENSIQNVISSVNEPSTMGDILYIETKKKNIAQEEYLVKVNTLLGRYWDEISK